MSHNEKAGSLRQTIENFWAYYIAYRMHELLLPLFSGSENLRLMVIRPERHNLSFDGVTGIMQKSEGQAWKQFVERNIKSGQEVSAFVSEYATKERWDRHWISAHNKARKRAETALREIRREVR